MDWPCDIKELIYKHYNVQLIQAHVRRWFYSHVHCKEWMHLLKLLHLHVSVDDYNILHKSRLVRREWRTEPKSWIYMLQNDVNMIQCICQEVNDGLWK